VSDRTQPLQSMWRPATEDRLFGRQPSIQPIEGSDRPICGSSKAYRSASTRTATHCLLPRPQCVHIRRVPGQLQGVGGVAVGAFVEVSVDVEDRLDTGVPESSLAVSKNPHDTSTSPNETERSRTSPPKEHHRNRSLQPPATPTDTSVESQRTLSQPMEPQTAPTQQPKQHDGD